MTDHDPGRAGKRNHAGRSIEGFEPAENLRLLRREAFGREHAVGVGAPFAADVVDPLSVGGITLAARRAARQMRVLDAIDPQPREGPIVQMSRAEAFKK